MITRHLPLAQSSCRIGSRITAEEYAGRRARLVQSVRKVAGQTDRDLVILLKGSRRYYIAPDVPGSYRQCSHFRYLSGVTVPNCYYLIHAPKRGGRLRPILFMNKRSDYEELWEGALPGESSLEITAGFEELLPIRKINEVITKMASSEASLFFESDDWAGTEVAAARTKYGAYHCLKNHIDELRLVKSPNEVQSMRDVCTIGSQVVTSTIAGCRGFDSEAAIGGLLEFEAKRRGAEMLAYPPVIAAGQRANTIHYLDANQGIEKSDCVLMDAGCDLNGYVSDVTRCFPISGTFSSAQRTLYDALLYVHEQLLAYAHDSEKVAESLCPHHVSHYLGMDVHDCTSISRDIDVPHGTVFTIEPGLYVPKDSQFPEEFHGIGLRIEDDVVATAEGIEVLTDAVPRSPSEIEYLMRSQ
ncbi:aminopeptidase P domain protein [Cooperia oncophora]